jgi:hypothetical protein
MREQELDNRASLPLESGDSIDLSGHQRSARPISPPVTLQLFFEIAGHLSEAERPIADS